MEAVKQATYKESSVGKIPNDWECKKISDICSHVMDGTHFTPTYVESGIPFYSVENVTSGNFTSTKYVSEEAHESMCRRVRPQRGDILMTRIGSVGKTRLIDWDVNASIYVSLALLRTKESMTPEFLQQYTCFQGFEKDILSRSLLNATPMKINLGEINHIPCPVPPLPEQKKIARILSSVDSKLALIDQQITTTQTLKKGLMQKLFTQGVGTQDADGRWQPHTEFQETELGRVPLSWEISPIGKHIELLSGYPFKSSDYLADGQYGLRLLRGDNIAQGWLRWRDVKFWALDGIEGLEKYFMQEGDVVIAMDRTWVSSGLKVSQVKKSDLPCILVQRVSRIRAKATLIQPLLKHMFSNYRFEQYVKGVQTDSVVPHLSGKQIQDFLIVVPPKKEQQEIARILSTVDRKLEQLQTQKAQTQQLKKGLMQKLLTGQIRVQPDPQDH